MVAQEYIDEAESGRVADPAPVPPHARRGQQAQRLLPGDPRLEVLRFTRKREHAVAFKAMLRRKGIRVTSITEHADDSHRQAHGGHHRERRRFYSGNLAQEVMRGMRESASRGFYLAAKAPLVSAGEGDRRRA